MEPQRASISSHLSSQTWENDYCIILKRAICKLNKNRTLVATSQPPKHMWIRLKKKGIIYQWKILWTNELWSCGPFWNLSKSLFGSETWRWCGVLQWERSLIDEIIFGDLQPKMLTFSCARFQTRWEKTYTEVLGRTGWFVQPDRPCCAMSTSFPFGPNSITNHNHSVRCCL